MRASRDIMVDLALAGLTPEQLALVMEMAAALGCEARSEPVKTRSAAAERQARYRARGGDQITQEQREEVFAADDYACRGCGAVDRLEVDHIVPLNKGGTNDRENLQTLCRPCNARKRDKLRKASVRANSADIGDLSADTGGKSADKSAASPSPLSSPPKAPRPQNTPPIIPPSSVISGARKADDRFDRFWKAYPRKTAKLAAEKAWLAALKRGATPDQLVEAAAAYARHPPDDPKFIPHAATWLNQGRYDDQPESPSHDRPRTAQSSGNGSQPAGRSRDGFASSIERSLDETWRRGGLLLDDD